MTVPTTVPAVLERAADLIDQRGLAKGSYVDTNGCLCARGAILAAVGIVPSPISMSPRGMDGWTADREALVVEAEEALEVHLRQIGFTRPWLGAFPIVAWSDAHDRPAAEVSAGLRAAAAKATL